MTAQIPDTFIFKGKKYSLIGIRGDDLISPQQFGMCPMGGPTSCHRGFYATYELTETGLYLRELILLGEGHGNYLPINDILPKKGKYPPSYLNLDVEVPFSGTIRLAKDFIEALYVHMGYQKPTAFKTVYDIDLKDGRIVQLRDRSKEMEKKRGAFKRGWESGDRTVHEAFSLDMDIE